MLTSDEIARATQIAVRCIQDGLPAYLKGRVLTGADKIAIDFKLDVGLVLDPSAFHRFIVTDGSVDVSPLVRPRYRDELLRLAELEKEANEIKMALPLPEDVGTDDSKVNEIVTG